MAELENSETEQNQEPQPVVRKKKFAVGNISKKMWTIIGASFFVILAVGIYFSPLGPKFKSQSPSDEEGLSLEEKAKKAREITYLQLPDMVVNLKNSKGKNTFLKAIFTLQIANEKEREHINYFVPLITDQFQTFLREMDVEDIQGAAGIERIRQELLIRINQVITTFKVKEVLVKEFIVQ
jgi:flagellar FliL protein